MHRYSLAAALALFTTPISAVPPSQRWSIPLAGLEAGAYQLVISVKDDGKGATLTRREPFEILGPSGSAD